MLRKAVELNPNYADAQHMLGLALRDQGRVQEWYVHAQRAVELDPLSAHYNMVLGAALAAAGKFDQAVASDRRALEIDPAMPAPYAELSLLQAYVWNRVADAVPLMEKAIALDPGDPKWSAWLTLLRLDLDDPMQATRLTAQNIARWPDSFPPVSMGAVTYASVGDVSAAADSARKALAIAPQETGSLAILRNADLQTGNLELARARYASAAPELMQGPNPRVDWMNFTTAIDLALVLQRTGQSDQAAALLNHSEKVIRGIPRLGIAGYGISDVLIHALRGDKAKALAALRAAEKAGWRGPCWSYFRDVDPNLSSIRNEPEFKAIFADIERDMARQRAELAARPKDAPLEFSVQKESTGK